MAQAQWLEIMVLTKCLTFDIWFIASKVCIPLGILISELQFKNWALKWQLGIKRITSKFHLQDTLLYFTEI